MVHIPDPHYRYIVESMPCQSLLLLPDFTIAVAGREYCTLLHTTRSAVTGKNFFEVFKADRKRNDMMLFSFLAVLEQGTEQQLSLIQYDRVYEDGSVEKKFWSVRNTPVIDNSRQVIYIIHQLTDITDDIFRSENIFGTEKLFRSLIENSSEGISLADENANVFYRSPAVEKMMGNLPKENALNRVHPDNIREMRLKVKEVSENPGKPVPFLARFQNEWGNYLWLEGTLTNLLHVKEVKAVVTNFRDVTTRIEAEEKMKLSENQLYNTLNNMLEGIQIHDFEWRYVFVNKALEKLARYSREELIGRTIIEIYPGIESTKVFEVMSRVMKSRISEELETEFVFPDGRVGYFQLSIEPVPEGIFVLSIDISERKKAEQIRIQTEENLKAIFDNATEGFILTDEKGIIKAFNNKVKDSLLVNVSDDVKIGLSIFNLTESERQPFLGEVFDKVLKGKTIQYDRRYQRKDGKIVYVNFTYNPVIKDGVIQGVCLTGKDITDRKIAEEQIKKSYAEKQVLAERMSVILNTLPANIALVDKSGRIIEVNDAWRTFAADGFKGKDYPVGTNYINVSKRSGGEGKTDKVNMASGLEAVLDEELDEFVYEYSADDTGPEKWFRMIATPLQETAYAGAVIMHMDISEIRRLEAERMRHKVEEQKKISQAILRGAEKERNHIGQELHDNINQILAGIRMYLAMEGNKDALLKQRLQYPLQLLDQSMEEIRLLCSSMVTPVQDIKLEDMIRELLGKMNKDNNIQVGFNYKVPGDPLSDELKINIYRIVQELSNNIVKYAAANLVTVDIWEFSQQLHMAVTDDGKGFNVSEKRKGIGISNIFSRVQSFNGSVKIESAEGMGTKTIINIPFK